MTDRGVPILLRCENGHEQRISVHGMTLEMADDYASILDGTNAFCVHPPAADPQSSIGKCGICRAPFRARVER